MGWLRREARGRQESRAPKRLFSRAATGQLLTRFFLPICSSPPNAAAMATCSYPWRQLAAPHLRSCARFQWLSTHENEGELLSTELDFVVVGWNRNSLTPLLFQLARRTLTRVELGCRIWVLLHAGCGICFGYFWFASGVRPFSWLPGTFKTTEKTDISFEIITLKNKGSLLECFRKNLWRDGSLSSFTHP